MKAATAKTRIQFRNILFATDFSPAAMRAIPIAKAIARNYDSNIVAVHVRGPVVNPMTPPAAWPMVLEAEKQRDELRRGELLSYFAGIRVAVRIEEGDILSHLAEAIKNDNVDLVVVGTHVRASIESE